MSLEEAVSTAFACMGNGIQKKRMRLTNGGHSAQYEMCSENGKKIGYTLAKTCGNMYESHRGGMILSPREMHGLSILTESEKASVMTSINIPKFSSPYFFEKALDEAIESHKIARNIFSMYAQKEVEMVITQRGRKFAIDFSGSKKALTRDIGEACGIRACNESMDERIMYSLLSVQATLCYKYQGQRK